VSKICHMPKCDDVAVITMSFTNGPDVWYCAKHYDQLVAAYRRGYMKASKRTKKA